MLCRFRSSLLTLAIFLSQILIATVALTAHTHPRGKPYKAPAIPTVSHANGPRTTPAHLRPQGARPFGEMPVFLPIVSYDASGTAGGMAVADLNGDGNPDVVVPNDFYYYIPYSVSVLLGNGHGWYEPYVNYDSCWGQPCVGSTAVAAGDLNGDGKPDLVVANDCDISWNCAGSAVSVLLGNGDGTFQSPAIYASGSRSAFSIVIADVNGDTHPDVVVANQCYFSWLCGGATFTAVAVLLGNGDGTLQSPLTYSAGSGSSTYGYYTLAVADVNGDRKPDVVVASGNFNNHGTVAVLLGNGDGTLHSAVDYDSGGPDTSSNSVAVWDLNGDGKPDILAGDGCAGEGCNAVGVLIGNGDGSFQPPVTYNTGGTVTPSVALADMDGDGKVDLVVPNGNIAILPGNGDGTFQPPVLYAASGTGAAVVADVNGDAQPDIVMTAGTINVLLTQAGASTRTAVKSSGSPVFAGQPVTFTATVTSKAGAIPDGEVVAFYDDIANIGLVKLVSGKATFTTSSLPAKNHNIRATYVGDAMFRLGSGRVHQKVVKYASTTSLTSSPNPSHSGEAVTFTATVTPSGPYGPTGKVKFRDGTKSLGPRPLNGGVSTLTISSLAVGTHKITAQYLSDAYNDKSTSPVVNQVVAGGTAPEN